MQESYVGELNKFWISHKGLLDIKNFSSVTVQSTLWCVNSLKNIENAMNEWAVVAGLRDENFNCFSLAALERDVSIGHSCIVLWLLIKYRENICWKKNVSILKI